MSKVMTLTCVFSHVKYYNTCQSDSFWVAIAGFMESEINLMLYSKLGSCMPDTTSIKLY